MDELFLKLLNMSISASWLVLAVLLARLVLKNAPKSMRCILWALVGIRLICPVSFESVLSLIPSAQTIPNEIVYASRPAIDSGVEVINQAVNPVLAASLAPKDTAVSVNPIQIWLFIAQNIWVLGMAALALYALISYLRLRRKVAASICLKDNVWMCDYIDTPFILGIFRPRIYLPSGMQPADMIHVLAHERAHLKRRDHWWKPLGFVILTVYWFNPVIWLAYILLCRDIELACDERVIRDLGAAEKKAYSEALLTCSVPRHLIAACPLAFGEVGVKQRIKSVLNYKKPAFWLALVAVVACAAVAVCFLTDPVEEGKEEPDSIRSGSQAENTVEYYLTIGAEGVTEVQVSTPSGGGGCAHADGTPFEKGEEVYLEQLSGMNDLAGVEITAVDQNGDPVYSIVSSADDGHLVTTVVNGSGWSLRRSGHEETGSGQQVSCRVGYANITLQLPDGWEYQTMSPQENYSGYGIAFWPKDSGGGMVKLMFHSSFGVSDSGLQEETAELENGLTGTFGYYHGSDIWSYMIYMNTPGSYVAQTENVDGWWEEYEDEVLHILGTAELGSGILWQSEAVEAARSVVSGCDGWPAGVFDVETGMWEVHFFRYMYDSFPSAIVTVDASGNVVGVEAMGVTLSAWEESPTGMDILGSQYGGVIRGQLMSGSYYCLQQWNGMRWEDVPVAFEGEYAWTMEGWVIEPGENFTWNVNWQWLYGTLPAGEYRIGKEITDHVSPEDSFSVMFYVPFTLYGDESWQINLADTDFSRVDQIRLNNCTNGLETSIDDPRKIEQICEFLSGISGHDGASGEGYYGGDYALTLYAGEETVLDLVFLDDKFFCGEHPSGYPIVFQMEGADRDAILNFFAPYDQATQDAVVRYLDLLVSQNPDPETLIQEWSDPVQYLVAYGDHTLRYCYGEFLKGGQDDLRGKIMSLICKEIIWDGAVDWDRAEWTGQQWFDAYLESVTDLGSRISGEEMKAYYPEQWILYEMTLRSEPTA